MILKRNFNPVKVVQYVSTELVIAIIVSLLVYVLHKYALITVTIPYSISAILGSALAIFVAFRNNTSYARWWEARTVWGNIINNSRIFARQVIANANNAVAIGKASEEKVVAYKREVIYRQIAYAHALRMHLRGQHNINELQQLLDKSELDEVATKQNVPNQLLLRQGIRIKEGMREEILGAFDNISIEPTLAGLSNFQGACERIKNTPLLRQYDYYTRLFLYVFIITLPFALIGDFLKLNFDYLMPVVSVTISFVFATIGKVGEVNEDPFENRITDIPMTAMCNTIEHDLMEMLGETNLPEKLTPSKGFLF